MGKHRKRMMMAFLVIVMAVTLKGDSVTGHGNDMLAPQQTTVEQMFLIHGSETSPPRPKHGDAGRSSVWEGRRRSPCAASMVPRSACRPARI